MASPLDPWYASLRSAIQAQLLGDWVFSSICVSRVVETFPTVNFDWTEPVISGYTTGETYSCSLVVVADVDVCLKKVTLTITFDGVTKFQIISPKTITRETDAATPVYRESRCPVRGVNQLCECSSFSKPFTSPAGTGSVLVINA